MSRTERIVVIGGSGMLGSALRRSLADRGLACVAPPRAEIDLMRTVPPDGRLAELRPSAVINASAFTDVAGAELEDHAEAVRRLNRDAPGELAGACRRLGVPFIHVSTDYVFDGRKTEPYLESDPVSPLQVYGRSKLEGELRVFEAWDKALVARTSTLYGPGPRRRLHYVDAILRQARSSSSLSVVRLPVSSPTHAPDLARGLIELLEAGARGLVNVVNDGGCSRLELARESVRLAGLGDSVDVGTKPEPPASLARPAYSVLDTSRFNELTGRSMRPWQEALAEYVGGAQEADSEPVST